ncbi:MAG: DUF3524 domain-containing protein [Flavobacteriales bacterium]|nr:DUF3524 domain-containing protein [Flavobacteriales bacterium]
MKVLLIEPFFSGSHKKWAEEYLRFSSHEVKLLTLPGKHWKWRMEGGAIKLAELYLEMLSTPDVILTTDMLNLTLFQSLTKTQHIPAVLYMHENQLTYPWSEGDKEKKHNRDFHYAFINYTSCLAADYILFNSEYHRLSFENELPRLLNMFPDNRGLQTVAKISKKSRVVPIGIDLEKLQKRVTKKENRIPIVLWNHRWEYDKNPIEFFKTLEELKNEGIEFQLVVLGEHTTNYPEVFDAAKATFEKELLHWGYCDNPNDYIEWLWKSDVLPVTSYQDFFGISVVEAMLCGVYPLLPHRLAFPEHLPTELKAAHLYADKDELKSKLKRVLIEKPPINSTMKIYLEKYDWRFVVKELDTTLSNLSSTKHGHQIIAP